jgi:hypothetical protein
MLKRLIGIVEASHATAGALLDGSSQNDENSLKCFLAFPRKQLIRKTKISVIQFVLYK